jgi:hypothetical protein
MTAKGKIVPKSKESEWKGLDRISLVVHGMRCIWREQEKDDIGIDGEIELCKAREDGDGVIGTGKIVKAQSKSGLSYVLKDSQNSFASPVSEKDLKYWNSLNVPMIYIVYHPEDDCLYWKDIKSYVRETKDVFTPPLRIEFNKKTDKFDESSYEELCELCEHAPERISLDANEIIYSNLLKVDVLPPYVFVSPVLPEKRPQFHDRLSGHIPPYVYKSGTVFTLDDPTENHHAISSVIDGMPEKISTEDWISQDSEAERNLKFLLNGLLHRYLRSIGLNYRDKPRQYFYNTGLAEDSPIRKQWKTRKGYNKERQVAKYYTYGSIKFYKHNALETKFENFGEHWALSLQPRLFFSTDGTHKWKGKKAASFAIRARSTEYNNQYLNHLLFWAYQMSKGEDTFSLKVGNQVVMKISGKLIQSEAYFGPRL